MISFLILSFFLVLGSFYSPKKQDFFLVVSFVILFIAIAYRDFNVGTDTESYRLYFYYIINDLNSMRQTVEPGWVFLNTFADYLGGEFRTVLVLASLAILLPIFFIAKKYSANPMLTIVVFYLLSFYFYSFNITRQMIAVSLILFGLVLLTKNKKYQFLVLVFLAYLFHTSALIVLPLFFVNYLPNDKINALLLIFASMVLGFFAVNLAPAIAALIHYEHYFSLYNYGNYIGPLLKLLIFNSFFVFIYLTSERSSVESKLFLAFILLSSLLVRIPFGSRIYIYLGIYQLLFYPIYLHNLKLRASSANFTLSKLFIFIYLYVVYALYQGSGGIYPYFNVLFS